ncbi:hypothetical protein BDP27DRAFT_1418981 [Rhodocollybia butyracea]|uniref:Fungal-type protein kinase domain-containing protein n=1 Tax=Rhodocollybia butyracea TaxID=206335 RepID=A0A9P5PYG2_9AGAR|nr:hypothetical protein BDP27DRAFT_1418981 [Rhodocollybia butyracea]
MASTSTPPAATTEITEQARVLQPNRPLSRGSSGHVLHSRKHDQSDFAKYSDVCSTHLDDFLCQVCGCDADWINGSRKIARSPQSLPIIQKLDTFCPTSRGPETRQYAPFVALADGLGHKEVWFCRNDNTFISGFYTSRKPDVAVVRVACLGRWTIESCNASGPSPPFWGRNTLSFNEIEDTIAEGSKTIDTEGFRSTLSLPSSSPIARKQPSIPTHPSTSLKYAKIQDFVLDLHIKDENIQLFHDDHSAVIFSRPVNIVGNIEHLLHLMDTMVFTRRGISSLINVTHDNVPSSSALRAPHLNLFPGVSLSLLNGTFCFTLQHEIIGQGSCVIRKGKVSIALAAVAKGSVCIVKLTRQARLSELALIDNACKLASSRHSEWVLHHLPTISLSADLPLTPRQVRLASFLKEGYGQHILRITVMTKLLPIAELTNPADLKIVFRDIFRCYRWLVEEAKILHRNVNVANITFQYGSDGSVYGVLNDFDHAIRTDVLRSPSSHRTGTAPYMAIDILCTSPPPIHLYRHDLESLYYVLVCSVCPADHLSILSWFRLGGHDMAPVKRTFFTKNPLAPRAGFDIFLKWIDGIHDAFFLGLHERDVSVKRFKGNNKTLGEKVPFDDETLGGRVSFGALSAIFEDMS